MKLFWGWITPRVPVDTLGDHVIDGLKSMTPRYIGMVHYRHCYVNGLDTHTHTHTHRKRKHTMATNWDNITLEDRWDCLEHCLGVSEETLKIVTDGWGFNDDTLETVLYAVSAYHTFDQLPDHYEGCPLFGLEEEEEEEEELEDE